MKKKFKKRHIEQKIDEPEKSHLNVDSKVEAAHAVRHLLPKKADGRRFNTDDALIDHAEKNGHI